MIPLDTASVWLAAGLLGQALFGVRFAVQWIYSERLGRSRFPRVFWQISVIAGAIILSYAIHRSDPVFIVGETTTLLVFLRNLHMLGRHSRTQIPARAAVLHSDDGRDA